MYPLPLAIFPLFFTATEYQQLHLPWGVPSGGEGSSSCLLTQQDYITLYSNALHIPLWTAFKLTRTVCTPSNIVWFTFYLTVFCFSKPAQILYHQLVVVFAEIHVSLHPTPLIALTTRLEEEKEERESLFL